MKNNIFSIKNLSSVVVIGDPDMFDRITSMFLKDNFKKNWKYEYHKNYDQHVFQLIDPSFGLLNDNLIKFYSK